MRDINKTFNSLEPSWAASKMGSSHLFCILVAVLNFLFLHLAEGTSCVYYPIGYHGFSRTGNEIKSPNFPEPYPPNVCFCWVLSGRPGTVVTLRILDLDMPGPGPQGACSGSSDSLLIGPKHKQRLCGRASGGGSLPEYRATLAVHSSVVYVIFNSTSSPDKGKGFRVQYLMEPAVSSSQMDPTLGDEDNKITDSGEGEGTKSTVIEKSSGGTSGNGSSTPNDVAADAQSNSSLKNRCYVKLTSQMGNIFFNDSTLLYFWQRGTCTWQIQGPSSGGSAGAKIKLWFRSCGFESSDKLRVVDTDSTLLGDYFSWQCPRSVVSKGNSMQVVFARSGLRSFQHPRLDLHYEIVQDERLQSSSADVDPISVPSDDKVTNHLTPDRISKFASCSHIIANESSGDLLGPTVSLQTLRGCSGQLSWLILSPVPRVPLIGASAGFDLRVIRCPRKYTFNKDRLEVFDGRDATAPLLFICDEIHDGSMDHHVTRGSSFYVRYSTNVRNAALNVVPSPHIFHISFERKARCLKGYESCGTEDACFHPSARCNGSWECPRHGGDELNCDPHQCPPETYSCKMSTHHCYSEADRCNGKGTCTNYMDEMNCEASLCNREKGLFLCRNGRCIYEKWRCDGTTDCSDNSDEEGCVTMTSPKVIVAAVVGSLTCSLLLAVALGCVCKVYRLRQVQLLGPHASLGPGHCCHGAHHSGRHDSPMSRQLAEMFRQRAPPPPYHEAMLTSRPYQEVARLDVIGEEQEGEMAGGEAGGDGERRRSSAGGDGGGSGGNPRQQRRGEGAGGGSAAAEDGLLRCARRGCRDPSHHHRRRRRREHRQVNQQGFSPSQFSSSGPEAGQENTGFIEVGSLTLLGSGFGGQSQAAGARNIDPPPYSVSDPAGNVNARDDVEDVRLSSGDGDNGEEDDGVDAQVEGEEGMVLVQQRKTRRARRGGGGDSGFSSGPSRLETSTVTRVSDGQARTDAGHFPLSPLSTGQPRGAHREDSEEEGSEKEDDDLEEAETASTSLSMTSRFSLAERQEVSLTVPGTGGGEEDSDSDCILLGEDKDEEDDEDGPEEDDEEDDDEEEVEEDSDDSDTACLLSAV